MTTLVYHKGVIAIDSRISHQAFTKKGVGYFNGVLTDDSAKLISGDNWIVTKNNRKPTAVAVAGHIASIEAFLGLDQVRKNPSVVISLDADSAGEREKKAGGMQQPFCVLFHFGEFSTVVDFAKREGVWNFLILKLTSEHSFTAGTGNKLALKLFKETAGLASAAEMVFYASLYDQATGGPVRTFDGKEFHEHRIVDQNELKRDFRRYRATARKAGKPAVSFCRIDQLERKAA